MMKRLATYLLAIAGAAIVGLSVPTAAQAGSHYVRAYHSASECRDAAEDLTDGEYIWAWCEYDFWDRPVWKLYVGY